MQNVVTRGMGRSDRGCMSQYINHRQPDNNSNTVGILILTVVVVVVGGCQRGDQGSETFCFYDRLTKFADLDCQFYMLFESVDMQHHDCTSLG